MQISIMIISEILHRYFGQGAFRGMVDDFTSNYYAAVQVEMYDYRKGEPFVMSVAIGNRETFIAIRDEICKTSTDFDVIHFDSTSKLIIFKSAPYVSVNEEKLARFVSNVNETLNAAANNVLNPLLFEGFTYFM